MELFIFHCQAGDAFKLAQIDQALNAIIRILPKFENSEAVYFPDTFYYRRYKAAEWIEEWKDKGITIRCSDPANPFE